MSNEIPKYNLNAECSKCGSADVAVLYCIGEYLPIANICLLRFGDVSHEHLDRTCRTCGYRWVEACLDDLSRG